MSRPPLPLGTWGTISVFPDGDGYRARARFRGLSGKTRQVQRSGPDAQSAERRLEEAMAAETGLEAPKKFLDLCYQWLRYHESRGSASPTTLRSYRRIIENMVAPHLGDVYTSEMSKRVILYAFEVILREKRDHKSLRTVLRQVCQYAYDNEFLSTPLHLDMPRAPRSSRRRGSTLDSAAEANEARAVLALWVAQKPAMRQVALDVYDLILATGARISETVGLRRSDLYQSDGVWRVSLVGALHEVPGKGYVRNDEMKTESAPRKLVIPAGLAHRLAVANQTVGMESSPWLFPSRHAHKQSMTPPGISSMWRRAFLDTRFAGVVTPHTLRRTVGTQVAERFGVTAAARQLGHSSTAVTEAHYIKPTPEVTDHTEALRGFLPDGDDANVVPLARSRGHS